MNIIMLGPPGSGKGTQAKLISQNLKIPHISTGELLREILKRNDKISKKIRPYVETGALVPDNLVFEVLKKKIKNCNNLIFDGFPRNITQVQLLEKYLESKKQKIDYVIYLDLDEKEIIKRLSLRRICPKCQKNYNLITSPPKRNNICDDCKINLVQREDDKIKTIKNRIKAHQKETLPLLDYYKDKIKRVDANDTIERVTQKIIKILKEKNGRKN